MLDPRKPLLGMFTMITFWLQFHFAFFNLVNRFLFFGYLVLSLKKKYLLRFVLKKFVRNVFANTLIDYM